MNAPNVQTGGVQTTCRNDWAFDEVSRVDLRLSAKMASKAGPGRFRRSAHHSGAVSQSGVCGIFQIHANRAAYAVEDEVAVRRVLDDCVSAVAEIVFAELDALYGFA